ncbi:MAG: hypothetical protein LBJ09_00335 [Clostridiales bacterium]|jgi:cyclic beta-1,2-glucan synthetase|nr:hypothetical protein [Clostridiales bacterium]
MKYLKNLIFKKRIYNQIKENIETIKVSNEKLKIFFKKNKYKPIGFKELNQNFEFINNKLKKLKRDILNNDVMDFPIKKFKSYPSIFNYVKKYFLSNDGIIEEKSLIDFMLESQKIKYFAEDEISMLEMFIQIYLGEKIAKYCKDMMYVRDKYNLFHELTKYFIENKNTHHIKQTLKLETSNFKNTDLLILNYFFLANIIRHSNENLKPILEYFNKEIKKTNTSLKEILITKLNVQAKSFNVFKNSIQSLKTLQNLDFDYIYENLSDVHKTLCYDPSNVYNQMDDSSKEYYKKRIKIIARKKNISELSVTKIALNLALKYVPNDEKRKHIGFYLINQTLNEKPLLSQKNKKIIYVLTNIFSSFSLTYVIKKIFKIYLTSVNNFLIFFIVLAISSEIAITFNNLLIKKLYPKKIVPKLKLKKIPDTAKTLVVISCIINCKEDVFELAKKIETYKNANNCENLYFGLLCDFKDSSVKLNNFETILIKNLEKQIDILNLKYGNFYLFVRKRVYDKINKIYTGFERKRGALNDLNSIILNQECDNFLKIKGDKQNIKKIKYVITLDTDTRLLLESAKSMISTMLHPLNKPEIENGKVKSGYVILQPNIQTSIESANRTHFSKVLSGQGGIESYFTSNIFQNLFDEGTFYGKGIYDVKAFDQILKGVFPKNQVLSHDLIEGSYARCASINETLLDNFPPDYISYCKRLHRWIRGDIQNSIWLFFNNIKNEEEIKIKNPICIISKWKIFDNLRRIILNISLPYITYLSLCNEKYKNFIWLTLLITFLPLMIYAFDKVLTLKKSSQTKITKLHSKIIFGFNESLQKSIFQLIFFPNIAYVSCNALVKSLCRTLISKRKMLEWTTAQECAQEKNNFAYYLKYIFFSVVYGTFVLIKTNNCHYFSRIICILWIFSPFIAKILSEEQKEKKFNVSCYDKKLLVNLAYKIWKYFDNFTNEENNYLTPDNFQEYPSNGIASRTSSTNIGMTLMSFMAAYDLNFINLKILIQKNLKTIETIEKLQKWNKHLYNWYDTISLAPLLPKSVSTVDNGNYIAFLMTLRQGFLKLLCSKELSIEMRENIKKIISFFERTISETKFKNFLDKKKKLFSLGYDCENNVMNEIKYDLLISESRHLSFITIANGEVDKEHWYKLSRKFTLNNKVCGLLSWTGTMFEYLMPLIIMENIPNTLLSETYNFAVLCQIENAKKKKIPWGASESGYYKFDDYSNYLYKAFGVSELSISKEYVNNWVISPYSSIMAIMVKPKNAIINIKKLIKNGFLGKYGLYEAIDYTKTRMPKGCKQKIIKSFMAHHQGMSLLSIDNFINKNIMQKRFGNDPKIKAIKELLEERIPTCVEI